MVSATEGWEGFVRIKLERNTTWGNKSDPYLSSAPFDTDVAMEKIYVIGNRNSVDTVEGTIEITGSIERPFFENASHNRCVIPQFTLADVCGLYGTNVSKCTMVVSPNSNFTYVLHSVKFHGYGLTVGAGDITTERADFTADNISTS